MAFASPQIVIRYGGHHEKDGKILASVQDGANAKPSARADAERHESRMKKKDFSVPRGFRCSHLRMIFIKDAL